MNILLSTLNSKFIHSSIALRYLKGYGATRGQAYDIVEYTINMPILDIISDITERDMDLVGFACYIWNIEMTLHVVEILKSVRPNIKIILGGPEVSFTADEILHRCPAVDFIAQGEGEECFADLVDQLETGGSGISPVIPGIRGRDEEGRPAGSLQLVEVKDLSRIPFPYSEEDMEDLEHKIIYYESSRGCPFSCQYCLSGNGNTVRFFPQERTLKELQWFMDHKVPLVKFVDRTFNCAPGHHLPMMDFMAKAQTDTCFHLEMEPELMTEKETAILSEAPHGRFQIEVGVQSTHKKTLDAISRYNDWPYIQKVIEPIIEANHTHVHMDLIVGLPYEDMDRFGMSFNDLFSLKPHALQLGFLKLLKGSGVRKMDQYQYVADPQAPYEVLSTHVLTYDHVRYLKHFEDVFERFYNSERFRTVFGYIADQLISQGEGGKTTTAFKYFTDMTDAWLAQGNHKRALKDIDQIEFLYKFFKDRGDSMAMELLQYDTLVSYKGKVRDQAVGLPKQTKELLQAGEDFWRNESLVQHYIPAFTFREWRKIRQSYVEMPMSKETAQYLNVRMDGQAPTKTEDGKYMVIMDVKKEIRPFVRPQVIA